jgi:aminopeptidase YwaD
VEGSGRRAGGGGGGRGGFGGPSNPELQAAQRKIPGHITAELNLLIAKKISALEIRDFLSGEFEPLPLEDLMAYFRAMEKAGTLKLTAKTGK